MKIRTEFISNSSSCSFVVSSELNRVPFLKELFSQVAIFPGETMEQCCEGESYFKNYTALLVQSLDFWNLDSSQVHLRGGHCIHNTKLYKYFDKNGILKKDLDFQKVIEDIKWYPDADDDYWDHHHCSRITHHTVQFSEWLYNKIKEIGGIFCSDQRLKINCQKDFAETLQKIKGALNNNLYVYYCWVSYEGDSVVDGYFYADLDDKCPSVSEKFKATNAVKEFINWDTY